jgi:hypothetical protein
LRGNGKCGKEPGSWATVLAEAYKGRRGRILEFVPEEKDGIPVPNGLKYFILQMEGVEGKVAFRREEILIHR